MAEPDDVEEDLFADLYDGDDNNGPNNNVVPAPPAAQPSLNETAMTANDTTGYGEEPNVPYEATSFDAEPQGQDESANGNHHEMRAHDMPEMMPQQERFNVNMKEDG